MAVNDTNESDQEDQPKPRSIVSLALWALVALLSIGAGFATPFVADQFGAAGEGNAAEAPKDEPPALVEFGEVTVNLNEPRSDRYLRLDFSLLVGTSRQEAVTKSLEDNKAILKSWLLSYLADKAMDDIRGATGQNRLRREIQTHFNSVMFPGKPPLINNVLFKEFNIQ